MALIWSTNEAEGIDALTNKIAHELAAGSKVLWCIPGGSNIPLSVTVLDAVRKQVSKEQLSLLTVTLTDERYGPVGHADSNWAQLLAAGFREEGITVIPVLRGLLLDETVEVWRSYLENAFAHTDVHIAQFGIGSGGHIAGALPHSPAISDSVIVCAYESAPFIRITLSTSSIARMGVAYVFAFGPSKEKAMQNLHQRDLSLEEEPAQVLKNILEVYIYSDIVSQHSS
jgi:6-phosphogluconolactonase/glucosamine-6-phosphate isomerase/deaminase